MKNLKTQKKIPGDFIFCIFIFKNLSFECDPTRSPRHKNRRQKSCKSGVERE